MTQTISDVSGAPLSEMVGGKQYTFYPLKLKHLGWIERWMKQEPLRNAREVIREMDSGDEKLKSLILEKAYEESSRLGLGKPGSESYLGSVCGIHQIVWHSLRQGDPSITIEMVEDLLDTQEKVERVGKLVMELSGLGESSIPFSQESTET